MNITSQNNSSIFPWGIIAWNHCLIGRTISPIFISANRLGNPLSCFNDVMFERCDMMRWTHYLIGQLQQKRIGGTCLGFAAVPLYHKKTTTMKEKVNKREETSQNMPEWSLMDSSLTTKPSQTSTHHTSALRTAVTCMSWLLYGKIMGWSATEGMLQTLLESGTQRQDSHTTDSRTSRRQERDASPCCASFSSETTHKNSIHLSIFSSALTCYQ